MRRIRPAATRRFHQPGHLGTEAAVRERFSAAGIAEKAITCEPAIYTFRTTGGPSDFLAIFRDFYGPTMNAYEAAGRSGRRAELDAELHALFKAENRGEPGRIEVPAAYLKVTIRK